jgi:hypothetical protein
MKNPLLAIIALVALAGILFAQGPPSSISAHSVVRQVELVGPIQVEGIVPLRNHVSIPWTSSLDAAGALTPFEWTCPAGTHARVMLISDSNGGPGHGRPETNWRGSLQLASGEVGYVCQGQPVYQGSGTSYLPNPTVPREVVLHPGDTLRLENIAGSGNSPCSSTGILQLAVEYD